MTQQGPGYRAQGTGRTVFRIVGIVAMVVVLILLAIAFADIFRAMNSDEFGAEPTKFWLFFVALPVFAVAGFCLNAGFFGVGARYAAGELAPTARSSMDYLGVGNGGVDCPRCGKRNTGASKYCDDCGQPIARTCSSCGTGNAQDSKFCASCGTALG